MSVCKKCGTEVADDAAFCPECGSLLKDTQQDQGVYTEPQSAAQPQDTPLQQSAQQQYGSQGPYAQAQGDYADAQSAAQPQGYSYNPNATETPHVATVNVNLGSDKTAMFDPQDISDNKVFALAAYMLGVLGLILASFAAHNSPYARFHVRQSVKLNVTGALLAFVAIVMLWILFVPILGIVFYLCVAVCFVIIAVLYVICVINVFCGKAKEVPIVGSFKFLK